MEKEASAELGVGFYAAKCQHFHGRNPYYMVNASQIILSTTCYKA